MTPQTINAYYSATKNEIVFPAAILQPPFFDPKADPAGHEITRGFDDQGRKSDGSGMLRDWWSPEDAAKFEAQAVKLGAQYEAFTFEKLPGIHITGKATMGENIVCRSRASPRRSSTDSPAISACSWPGHRCGGRCSAMTLFASRS